MNFTGRRFVPTHPNIVELDRIGDEIAELSAHLDAATARLLDLIREFDARRDDPDFQGDPYARYGGRSLRRSSPSC